MGWHFLWTLMDSMGVTYAKNSKIYIFQNRIWKKKNWIPRATPGPSAGMLYYCTLSSTTTPSQSLSLIKIRNTWQSCFFLQAKTFAPSVDLSTKPNIYSTEVYSGTSTPLPPFPTRHTSPQPKYAPVIIIAQSNVEHN